MLKTSILVLTIVFLSYSPSASIAQAPTRGINEYTTQELVEYFAHQYGNSSTELTKVMMCESSGNEKAWNKLDPGVGSKGVMQFQEGTFYGYAAKINIKNPDIWSKRQQIEVASYMFSQGLSYHWSCAKILGIVK